MMFSHDPSYYGCKYEKITLTVYYVLYVMPTYMDEDDKGLLRYPQSYLPSITSSDRDTDQTGRHDQNSQYSNLPPTL